MIGWVVRGVMVVAGVLTGLFIAKDAPNFGVIQMMISLLVIALIVAVFAFWPTRWTVRPRRSPKSR